MGNPGNQWPSWCLRQASRARGLSARVRNSALKPDLDAAVFSVKCFAAAILAVYLSLRIGLTSPVWAIGAVYTVSQPLSGASVSRGVFRFLGTVGGAAAIVLLVPTFASEPLVLSVVMAAWTGFCLYLALLDRTPRSYAFQLAGYMTCLIGFPYVAHAGDIFTVAALRVQEVSIGILCATLVHALVLPRSVSDRVTARVGALLGDAERSTRDTLRPVHDPALVHDRLKIAAGLLDIHQNSIHLPFDSARDAPRVEILRSLHDRLLAVLSLSGAIGDSVAALRADAPEVPAGLVRLFERVRSWLDAPERRLDPGSTDDLLRDLRAKPVGAPGSMTWRDLLLASLASDLHDLVVAHQDCRLLERELRAARPGWWRRLPARLAGRGQGYVVRHDHWLAARSGLGVMVGITLCCCFWIASGWSDGASALFVLGPLCVLCGTVDAPIGNVTRSLLGMVVGLVVGLVYGFVIFPRTTDFATLAAVLAPVLLATGAALARPPLAFAAVSMVLTFPVVAGFSPTNAANFSAAINSSLAALIGGAMALFSVRLFQTIGTGYSTGRILGAICRDVATRAAGGSSDGARWTSGLVDRIGLLVPRLAGHRHADSLMRRALADLRAGQAAGDLYALQRTLDRPAARALLRGLLDDVATELRRRAASGIGPSDQPLPQSLLGRFDEVKAALAAGAEPVRGMAIPLLVALRRDLSPSVADHGV